MSTELTPDVNAATAQGSGGELANVEELQERKLQSVFGDTAAPVLHNFQGTNMEVWRKIATVTAADCLDFDSIGEDGIELFEFYVHSVEFVDDATGQVTNGIRSVLIPREGQPFACVSDGIARDLSGIIRTFGFGPYDPPIHVKPVSVKTRKGRRTYRLVPVE